MQEIEVSQKRRPERTLLWYACRATKINGKLSPDPKGTDWMFISGSAKDATERLEEIGFKAVIKDTT